MPREQTIDQQTILYALDQVESKIDQTEKKDGYTSESVTADFIITDGDKLKTIYVTTAASVITVTLPAIANNLNRIIEIIKIDTGSGSITVDGNAAETINGRATYDRIGAQYHGLRIKCLSTGWIIEDWIAPAWKRYTAGVTYNGVTLNVTGTNMTVSHGYFIPYQLITGQWRMKIDFYGTVSVPFTQIYINVVGILFTQLQNIMTFEVSVGTWTRGYAINATNQMYMSTGGATSSVGMGGDVELASKPTWAD